MILFSKEVLHGLLTGSKQQVRGVTSVLKCDFNRVAMRLCWGHTLAHLQTATTVLSMTYRFLIIYNFH